jgi:uncharacterized integral membrane protein
MSAPGDREVTKASAREVAKPRRAERLRLAAALLTGALITLFGVVNLRTVQVDWVVAKLDTPLIVVIALSLFAGAALDRTLGLISRRRRGREGRRR